MECSKCGKPCSISDFYVNKGYRNSWCKDCHYEDGNERRIEQKDVYADRRRRFRQKRQEWLDDLKRRPCVDCGGSFDPVCMDFDHLDQSTKTNNISSMMADGVTKVLIEAEILKCELVCANCHRLRTKKRKATLPLP
jgi:hypothetical protein